MYLLNREKNKIRNIKKSKAHQVKQIDNKNKFFTIQMVSKIPAVNLNAKSPALNRYLKHYLNVRR